MLFVKFEQIEVNSLRKKQREQEINRGRKTQRIREREKDREHERDRKRATRFYVDTFHDLFLIDIN